MLSVDFWDNFDDQNCSPKPAMLVFLKSTKESRLASVCIGVVAA